MEDSYLDNVEETSKKKGKTKRMRNLAQYKDLSEDEFNALMEKRNMGADSYEEFEKKIAKKIEEYERDYDLSDLKINDLDTLRALIQAQLTLEDYERFQFMIRQAGISESFVFSNEKLSKVMSDLRSDISKFQTDLNITRRVRKSDQDVSVLAYIEDLKKKAKTFYESKMMYIFCEKCNMLLGTIWMHYPDEERNKVALVCNRVLDDGSKCSHKTIVDTKSLLKNRGTNNPEVTPESMR